MNSMNPGHAMQGFVMADRLLSGSEQNSLSDAFEKVEIDKLGAGTHERLHKLMERLYDEIFPRP